MGVRFRAVAIACGIALLAGACSGGGSDDADGAAPGDESTSSTAESTTTTTSQATSTTTAETTTTTESDGPATSPDVLAADGISSPEDVAVFVLTSWIGGDREAASRHADQAAIESLFAEEPPSADSLELIECDTADLTRYDCFFAAAGQIIIVGVERLRVTEASIDSD